MELSDLFENFGKKIIDIYKIDTICRENFYDKQHSNYKGKDGEGGPVIISVMNDATEIIVRTASGTCSQSFNDNTENDSLTVDDVSRLVKTVCPELSVTNLTPVDGCEELIATYDDNYHQLLKRKKYAFGVLYQKSGQTTELEIFSNVEYCDKFAKFLKLLGDYHESSCDNLGYFVKDYNEMKMKFYAVTHLPYSETDSQQCMRKARIGNCVVSVVFQSEEATFSPEIITSQFLHVYVVIQPLSSNSGQHYFFIVHYIFI